MQRLNFTRHPKDSQTAVKLQDHSLWQPNLDRLREENVRATFAELLTDEERKIIDSNPLITWTPEKFLKKMLANNQRPCDSTRTELDDVLEILEEIGNDHDLSKALDEMSKEKMDKARAEAQATSAGLQGSSQDPDAKFRPLEDQIAWADAQAARMEPVIAKMSRMKAFEREILDNFEQQHRNLFNGLVILKTEISRLIGFEVEPRWVKTLSSDPSSGQRI